MEKSVLTTFYKNMGSVFSFSFFKKKDSQAIKKYILVSLKLLFFFIKSFGKKFAKSCSSVFL